MSGYKGEYYNIRARWACGCQDTKVSIILLVHVGHVGGSTCISALFLVDQSVELYTICIEQLHIVYIYMRNKI